MADADRAGERDEPIAEIFGDRLVEQEPAASDAGLPLVVEDRERGAVEREVLVGIGEHHIGALAPELELEVFQVAG